MVRLLLATFCALLALGTGLAQAIPAPKLLRDLQVKSENGAGYDRDLFDHWIDADRNSCDARQEVLLRQNRAPGKACNDKTGSWYSAYDGLPFSEASRLDIDHMIPLAEAWDSGARTWNEDTRTRYANDLYGYSLIAVSASSNRSKSDRDPAEWLPPRQGYLCTYLARWVAVKYRWRLGIDQTEKAAISSGWRGCSSKSLEIRQYRQASIGR
jgi:hypothetical protein